MNDPGPLNRIPIVIGVTGHRDLRPEDVKPLSDALRRVLADIKSFSPATPLILLSPLAEGADRLVASLATEPEIGARLIVPLPLPQEMYERDFAGQASIDEFHSLLDRARGHVYEVPLVAGNTLDSVARPGEARNLQYTQVGAFIVRHCHVLIALWNGQDTGLEGGTGQIVRFMLEGVPLQFKPHGLHEDQLELGPVVHLATPRTQEARTTHEPFTTRCLYPTMERLAPSVHPGRCSADPPIEMPELDDAIPIPLRPGTSDAVPARYDRIRASRWCLQTILQPIREFNHVLDAWDDAILGEVPQRRERLMPDSALESIEPASLRRRLSDLRELYAVTDAASFHFQRRTVRALEHMHWLVLLAAFCFDLVAHHLIPETLRFWRGPFLLLYPALIFAAYRIHKSAKGEKCQDWYQDFRAIAEALRVQFFWHIAALSDSVLDSYLGRQRIELFPIRSTCRAGFTVAGYPGHVPDASHARVIARYWVRDQFRFFTSRLRQERRTLERREIQTKLLLGVGLVAAAVTAVVLAWLARHDIPTTATEEHAAEGSAFGLIMMLIVMTGVGAGLLHNLLRLRARSDHIKLYQPMRVWFGRAAATIRQLLRAGNLDGIRAEVRALGENALQENGDWVLLHRARPIEPPQPG